jgi:hypothetical protein
MKHGYECAQVWTGADDFDRVRGFEPYVTEWRTACC